MTDQPDHDMKPCPFCGSPGEVYTHAEIPAMWIVGCALENCRGEVAAYDYVSRETAVAAWNTRAPDPDAKVAAMVKNEFGHLLTYTCQSYKSLCEERAEDYYNAVKPGLWDELKARGCRVVQVEVKVLED